MTSRLAICLAFLTLLAGSPSLFAVDPPQTIRSITCFVVVEEGASSEGNSLFLQRMGADPEALKSFAPSRFTRSGGRFSATVSGSFAYQADTPELVERSGRLALYQVPVRLKAQLPPKPEKSVQVTISLSDLGKAGAVMQPAYKAMDLAAASLKWKSGSAWIIEMQSLGKGKLKAVVGLAR
jgi:hypothetical protein